ncbi:MAG: hypothetical protein HOL72_05575 [Euryarchaeota archaeon]|nr:hypothetical protein [Euryarchaeota archaeon]
MRTDNMVVLCILILGCVLSLSPLILFSDSERIDSVTRDELSNEQIISLEEGPFAKSIKDDNAIIITSACLVNNSLIIAGEFSGSLIIAGIEYRSQGSSDILVASLYPNGTWAWVEVLGGEGNDRDATIEYDEGHLILKGSIFGEIDSRDGSTVGSADKNGQQRIIAELAVESGSWEFIFVDPFGDLVSSSSIWCGWR